MLDLFWTLLEFDPDRVDTAISQHEQNQQQQQQHVKTETVQFHVETSDTDEERQLSHLLRTKVTLMKRLLEQLLVNEDSDCRITIEQAKRLVAYS